MTSLSDQADGEPLLRNLVHNHPNVVSMYDCCRNAEQQLLDSLATNVSASKRVKHSLKNSLICIRVLGHLLAYGPTLVAQQRVADDISKALAKVSTADEKLEELIDLGEFYRDNFLRNCECIHTMF